MKKQHIFFLDILFTSILIFLLAFSYLSYKRIEKLKMASDWVNHSTVIKLKLDATLVHVLDAETGQRGYLLTHDPVFLGQYKDAFSKADINIRKVIILTADNKLQRQKVRKLQAAVKSRFRILDYIVRYRDSKDYSAEGVTMLLRKGKTVMDSTRTLIKDMIANEDRLLEQRLREKQHAGSFTPVLVLLFSVFAILFVVIAYIKVRSETHLRMDAQSNEATVRKLQQESAQLNTLLESKVNERTMELQKKNALLENMNDELLSFNYVASHDLQEPLRKIQAFANRIMETEENFSDKTRDYFMRMTSAASRMQKLLEALISYSRANSTDMDFTPTDLNQLLEEVKSDIRDVIEEKKAIITGIGLPTLNVIPLQFHQLFLNLLMNAIKYTNHGKAPEINITAELIDAKDIKKAAYLHSKSYWKIAFDDNGIGFEKEYQEKIFELFQRLHGKNEFEGTGIGLAICRKIVQNHNGHIFAEGRPREGATFFICLPFTN